ncbi:hypothetical protein [Granulicella sp. S190]|uniref:hypothetical protein n=1 Tax=Granulicella sp. S190 TaxID=1747226 RepID=UPI00131BA6C5|nr:hypothetical protein [Granulicella sp. S190]
MLKICFIALIVFPAALYSQSPEIASSSVSSTVGEVAAPAASIQSSPQTSEGKDGFFSRGLFAKPRKDTPVGSFTVSYVYRYAQDLQGASRSQMGWSAVPEVNFTKYVGLQAEFSGLYTRSIADGTNQVLMAAGPRFTFAPRSKVTPFVFLEGGEIRTTQQGGGVADWNPAAIGGIGLDYKISRRLALQLVPGEYMATNQDNGNWNNSFVAKAGITFNLFK